MRTVKAENQDKLRAEGLADCVMLQFWHAQKLSRIVASRLLRLDPQKAQSILGEYEYTITDDLAVLSSTDEVKDMVCDIQKPLCDACQTKRAIDVEYNGWGSIGDWGMESECLLKH